MSFALLALLALSVSSAGPDGGHATPALSQAVVASDQRRTVLDEMWQRRLLPPDQKMWSPDDYALLEKIRRDENGALELLKRKFGSYRPWVARPRGGALAGVPRLTKEGHEKYVFVLSQEALEYFESKGADAKWAFKLRDWDGKPLFDGRGSITEDGARVYHWAKLNREVFWRSPDGAVFGTRRPPKDP